MKKLLLLVFIGIIVVVLISFAFLKFSKKPITNMKSTSSCVIFPQELCNSADLVNRLNAQGEVESKLIFLKMPNNVPVYSPMDGSVIKAKGSVGIQLAIMNPNDPNVVYTIEGSVKDEKTAPVQVKKGDVIGHTQEGQKLPVPANSDYNIIIHATKSQNNQTLDNPDALKALFPNAFKKGPAGKFSVANNSSAAVTPTFLPPKYGN